MNRKRFVEALKVIKEELPGYFEHGIMSDCPCDLGLPASMRQWCGMEDENQEMTLEHCDKCWADALGENN